VACWGSNSYGQLGTSVAAFTSTPTTTPARVPGVRGATSLAAGAEHTCALVEGNQVVCWGRNNVDQLADGSGQDSFAPRRVQGL
jgi:alpha-tubulin suppressor-like RCC1 family protein